MMLPQRTAVAIVGAGPAGCAAALALAEEGVEAVLLERGLPGKDKACGDAFTQEAIAALISYGLTEAELVRLGGVAYQQVVVAGFGERYPGESLGWVVRRASIDQWLRNQVMLQVPLHYGVQVTAVVAHAQGFQLTLRCQGEVSMLTADAVVLATGSVNSLSQAWGVAGAPILGASLSIYAEGHVLDGLDFRFANDLMPGYGWIFPAQAGQVNLGVCALGPAGTKGLRERAIRFAADWQIPSAAVWRGGGEALWSGAGQPWHHPAGIISCGDAGGMVDPLSAEGITAALVSGKAGGVAIAQYLKTQRNENALEGYSQWVKHYCNERYFALGARRLLWKIWGGV